MSNRNSKIIIAKNIKLDKTYKNVLSYNEESMINYVNANVVASRSDYSFIRERNTILVDFSYSDAIKCNYMAYQNPDFSNKWFFAFIDNVKYRNDSTVEITFTIDVWSTWFSKMNFNQVFVIREHVNDDTVGLHTVPEGLDKGEFISNAHTIDDNLDTLCYIVSSSANFNAKTDGRYITGGINEYNGIYSGTTYYRYDDKTELADLLNDIDKAGQIDTVNGLFMAPTILARTPLTSGLKTIVNTDSPVTYENEITKQTTLDGYTPKNNKLLTIEYNYLMVSNNNGASFIYDYEDFSTNTCKFKVDLALTPGCSIRQIPLNYKGNAEGDEYGVNMGKYPICSYPVDMYTNWLTQNSINLFGESTSIDELNAYSGLVNGVGNITSGGISALGIANTGVSIASSMITKKQHDLIPAQTRGNLNSGDVITSEGKNSYHFYKMSVKSEYARMIDDYFTAKGYLVNRLKTPNIYGRNNFNYIQIDNESNLCYGEIPSEYLDIINAIARQGVTIWHNHSTLLNYSVDNSII